MSYIQGTDRSQITLPICLEDMISDDNPVRVIDAFVDMLDMEQLGFERNEPAVTGRPAYDPRDLLKLFIYGYFFAIRSSRKQMRECARNIELFYLLRGLKPDFRTIADFRKNNPEAIRNAFVELTRFCAFLALYDKAEALAVDGTKIRAVNANKKMYNKEILEKKCSRIREKLEEYMKETARMDEAEEKEAYEEISEKMKTLRDRKELYQRWRDELIESGETQKLTTDPQTKMMHTTKDGYHCCYNVQTAVSARSKLIVDYKVTNHVNDQGILHDFGKQIQKTIDCQTIHFIADKGYDSNEEIVKCIYDGIVADVGFRDDKKEKLIPIPFVAETVGEKERNSKKPEDIQRCIQAGVLPFCYEGTNISLEVKDLGEIGAFLRGEDKSYVICPMGKRLGKVKERRGGMVYKSREACRGCNNRCTASTKAKEVYFGPESSCVAARMYGNQPAVQIPPDGFTPTNSFYKKNPIRKTILLRIAEDPGKQRERMCISEHPFGTLKRYSGADYVLCKGIKKSTGELGLSFLAYNLKRMIKMMGVREIETAMRGV